MISGRDALSIIGNSSKKGRAEDMLKKYGLSPVFSKKFGRGHITFYEREKVVAAAAAEAKKRAEYKKRESLQIANNSEKTRFIPTLEALEVLRRIESKMDRLLEIWGDGSSSIETIIKHEGK